MSGDLNPYPGNMRCFEVKPRLHAQDIADILHKHIDPVVDSIGDRIKQYEADRMKLMDENEALRHARLPNEVFAKLAAWLRHNHWKPASAAFTHGMERQIAYALELDVLPEVRRLHQREQALMETVTRLVKAGNMPHDHVAHRHKESSEAWRGEVKHAEEHGHVTSY